VSPLRPEVVALAVLPLLLLTSLSATAQPVPVAPAHSPSPTTSPGSRSPAGSPLPAPRSIASSGCSLLGSARSLEGRAVPGASTTGYAAGLSAHSVDPGAVPNQGFEFNLTGSLMPTPPSGNASFLLTEEEVIGSTALVMGVISVSIPVDHLSTEVTPFWASIDNTTDQFTACGADIGVEVLPGQVVNFQAVHLGGDYWEVLYRGLPFGNPTSSANITLGGYAATWTGGISMVTLANWTGSTPWVPQYVNLTGALNVLLGSGGWYLAHPVYSGWNGSRGGPFWGEAGPSQLPYLAPGEMEIGSSVPVVANGTALWTTSAPTPIVVSVSAAPTDLSGGAPSSIVVHAAATDGVPLSGLGVLLAYAGGGSFSPTLPWTTNAQGVAKGNFTAPIVSTPLSGALTAEVSSTSYEGSGSVNITVAPTTLSVAIVLSPKSVEEAGTVNVSVRATLGALPLRGPTIDLDVSASVGGGAFSPVGEWSANPAGYANGSYTAPHAPGAVVLSFEVALTGYNGTGTAWINVTGASTASGSTPSTEEEIGGGVAVVLVVVLVAALALGRRRSPPSVEGPASAPEASMPEEPGTPSPETPAGKPEVAETSAPPTCPGCGREVEPEEGRFCKACGSPLAQGRFRAANEL
jgi:hypothetical protein